MTKRYSGKAAVDVRMPDATQYESRIYVKGKKAVPAIRVGVARSSAHTVDSPEALDSAARSSLAYALEDGALEETDIAYDDKGIHVGRTPNEAYARSMLARANPNGEGSGLSTTATIALGVGAVAVVGLGLAYVMKTQADNKSFGQGSTWGPPSFQLTPAARALIQPSPNVIKDQFVALTDVVATTPVILQVTGVQIPLATGVISSVGPNSTMVPGQTALFNIADAIGSSATLAALAQALKQQQAGGSAVL